LPSPRFANGQIDTVFPLRFDSTHADFVRGAGPGVCASDEAMTLTFHRNSGRICFATPLDKIARNTATNHEELDSASVLFLPTTAGLADASANIVSLPACA
jgi:hypothetical protein